MPAIAGMFGNGEPIDCTLGACCIDGSCLEVSEAECDSLSGFFAGPGTFCEGEATSGVFVDCTLGACCNGGECAEISAAQCAAEGGYFSGPDTVCDTGAEGEGEVVNCELGACCLSGGQCVDVSQLECEESSGYFSAGGNCDTTDCSEGACCLSGDCAVVSAVQCAAQEGYFGGAGTECLGFEAGEGEEPVLVDCTLGACCNNGACTFVSAFQCEVEGGYFVPEAECEGTDCAIGACCKEGGCTEISAVQCAAQDGQFRGASSTCADDPDGDGVTICDDVCPETAAGATVDANGCSCEQAQAQDNPLDSDGDEL